jgi:hypothetical protein
MTKVRDCDIVGCNRKAAEIIAMENEKEFFTIAMCSIRYEDYRSDSSLDKPFNLKDVPVQEKHN